jgi:hypothetical protein
MLMGAAIGLVVALVFYFVQQQQKNKNDGEPLDS